LEALTWGLLLRDPPEVGRWLSILEGHLERPESAETWRAFSLELRYLRLCDARRAERFLERLFQKYPQVRDSDLGTRLVAETRWLLRPATLRAFIHAMRDGPWRRGPQAYGELLGLSLFSNLNEPWIQDEVKHALDPATADCPKTRDTRIGLAFAAARAWRECELRHRATELLVGLVPLADRELAEAIMSAFLSNEKLYADDDSRRMLSSVLDKPLLMEVSTIYRFVKRLPDVVTAFPDLVYRLTREMVRRFGVAIADFRTHLAGCGEHLTDLAMTLQRLGGEYREKGLVLFEDLLEIGVREAKTTLVEIDRRTAGLPR